MCRLVALWLLLGACTNDSTDGMSNAGSGGQPIGGSAGTAGTAGVGGSGASGGTSAGAGTGTTGGAGGSGGASGGAGGISGASASGGAGGNGGAPPEVDASTPDPDAAIEPDGAIYIAIDGDDDNPGTESMPLASLSVALERVTPGGTILIKPGTYAYSQTVRFTHVGSEAMPIQIFAAEGARPVIDFDAQPKGDSSARGLQISGSYYHLRGFDVINAGDNCIHISGSYNTIERINTYGCSDTGLQITANGSEAGDDTRAAYNTVLNCDSYDNYDEANAGENADGFAAKLYIGPGNVFRGCRAWNNADDGWDFFASDDVVVLENCWAIANGKIGPLQNNTNGDGNGFKLGGAARAGDANMGGAAHQVTGCFSIENRACGFTRNNNTQDPELSMCGGRGDGKGLLCSLSSSSVVTVTSTAADAIAAERDADGNLPDLP